MSRRPSPQHPRWIRVRAAVASGPSLPPRARSAGARLSPVLVACLSALIVATPLLPGEAATRFGTGAVLNMLALVLLAAWFLLGALGQTIRLRVSAADAGLLVLLLLHAASTLVMAPAGNPRLAINTLWTWIALGVLYFLLRQLVWAAIPCRALCAVMMSLAVCLSVQACYQYAVSMPRLRAQYQVDPAAALLQLGIDPQRDSAQRMLFENRLASSEPPGPFALTNSLAGFLAPWLVIALVGAAAQATGPERARAAAWGPGLAAGLMAAGLTLTKSRSAMVSVALGLVVVALLGRWRRGLVAGAVAALLLATLWMALGIGGMDWEVLREAPKSVWYRVQYWQATAQLIGDFPWWGCGPGQFQDYYLAYKAPQASEAVADPHNFLLEVWATAGTPAAAVLLLTLGVLAWRVVRTAAQLPTSEAQLTVAAQNPTIGPRTPGPSDDPATDAEDSVAPGPIYVGAALGVPLAYLCGWLAGFVPDPAVAALGVPVAATVLWLLAGWVRSGALAARLPALGLAVLLINLLAAGGISFPGVAVNAWLLMAVTMNLAEPAGARVVARPLAIGLLVISAALAFVQYQSMYVPVLRGQALLIRGRAIEELARSGFTRNGAPAGGPLDPQIAATYRRAAETDPYAPEAWMHLAQFWHRRWMAEGQGAELARFEQAVQAAVRLQPRSHSAHRQIGTWYLKAYRVQGAREHLEAAARFFRRAVELYPNSAIARAELAWIEQLADLRERSAATARIALELDQLNPHQEHKLRDHRLPDDGPAAGQNQHQPPGPEGSAEDVVRRLLEGA